MKANAVNLIQSSFISVNLIQDIESNFMKLKTSWIWINGNLRLMQHNILKTSGNHQLNQTQFPVWREKLNAVWLIDWFMPDCLLLINKLGYSFHEWINFSFILQLQNSASINFINVCLLISAMFYSALIAEWYEIKLKTFSLFQSSRKSIAGIKNLPKWNRNILGKSNVGWRYNKLITLID